MRFDSLIPICPALFREEVTLPSISDHVRPGIRQQQEGGRWGSPGSASHWQRPPHPPALLNHRLCLALGVVTWDFGILEKPLHDLLASS